MEVEPTDKSLRSYMYLFFFSALAIIIVTLPLYLFTGIWHVDYDKYIEDMNQNSEIKQKG